MNLCLIKFASLTGNIDHVENETTSTQEDWGEERGWGAGGWGGVTIPVDMLWTILQ